MKLKKIKSNSIIILIIVFLTLFISNSGFGIASDREQPIHIESDMQSIDMQNNIITFIKNVILIQGTIKIRADKIVITSPSKKNNNTFIDGYGKPATFYQIQDNCKPIQGYAFKIHHELVKNLIILTGNAHLERVDGNITGDKIIYLVKKQKMEVYSEKGKHVTTILSPLTIQNNFNNFFEREKNN